MGQMALMSESCLESDLANRQLILAKQIRRPFNAAPDYVLMDRYSH